MAEKLQETPQEIPTTAEAGLIKGTQKVYRYIDSLIAEYNPNEFMTRKGFKTIDKMLRDDQISSILEIKKLLIMSSGVDIGYEDENEENEEICDFIEKCFIDNISITKTVKNVLSAYEYGFSVSELIMENRGGKYEVTDIKTLPPHSVDFKTDDLGNVVNILQQQKNNSKAVLPTWKFIHLSRNTSFNIPYGKTDLERCYRPWFLKDLVFPIWGIYAQKYVSPFAVASVPMTMTQTNKESLRLALEAIQQSQTLVIPKEIDIELQQSTASGQEYNIIMERCNSMISRGLLMPDLVGFGKDINGGSFALGKQHFDMFFKILKSDQDEIETVFNEAIKMVVILNFGEQEYYPKLYFQEFENDKKFKILDYIIQLIDKRIPINKSDIEQMRSILDLSPLDEANPYEYPAQVAPVINKPDANFIKLSKADKKDSITQIKGVFDKFDTSTTSDVASIMKLMREKLKLKASKILTDGNIKAIDSIQLANLGELKDTLTLNYTQLYRNMIKQAKSEVKTLKGKQFKNLFEPGVQIDKAVKAGEKYIDNKVFLSVGKVKDDILNKSKQSLLNGISKGKGEKEISKEIDDIFAPYTTGVVSAGGSAEAYLIDTIVRTEGTFLANLARTQVAQENKDFVTMYEYSAVMDDRTTDICSELDGFVALIDDPIWDSITPPNHFNCRSVLQYVTTIDVEQDGIEPDPTPDLSGFQDTKGVKEFL